MSADQELYTKVFGKVINFLSYSARSRKEVEDAIERYLYKEEISQEQFQEIKDKVLQEITDLKLIDDEAYARDFVEGKVRSGRPFSKTAVINFLYKKGIDKTITDEVLGYYTGDFEREAVEKLAEKKLRTLREDDPFKARNKLIAYLLGKGYSPDIVYVVVDTKFKVQ